TQASACGRAADLTPTNVLDPSGVRLPTDDAPAVATAGVQPDVDEAAVGQQALGELARVVVHVGGVELIVDYQAAFLRGEPADHVLEIVVQRQGQDAAERD